VQQLINSECPDWPEEVELGFRAGVPLLEVKLSTRQPRHSALQQHCYGRLQQLMGEYIIGRDDSTLATAVVAALAAQGSQISCAESCTGGAIAAAITAVAGASAVFEAGFVTYSNTMKQQLVGVSEQSLAAGGAVSEAVAREMALGAMTNSGARYGIAVTGIAGPGGGSDDKPVGTVWIAWGTAQTLRAHRFALSGTRAHFQLMVTAISLDLIRRELLGIAEQPRYFARY
jgi:nicotinamide-nucleotide amidase